MTRGAYILAPLGPDLSPREAAFFKEADPWGFILFARNCETPEQLRRLTKELRSAVGWYAPILIDQEGGRVQRMRAPHWREYMPPLDQVALFDIRTDIVSENDAFSARRSMYLRGLLIGHELMDHGVDVNCAPSADIAWPETHPFLKNRCYGTNASVVARMAEACAEGLMDAGCLPVVKHAPGHGRATLDSHKELPRIGASLEELSTTDFAAFKALSDLPMVMTAHIVLPEIDADVPVTLAPKGVRYLRQSLELDGLLMTDDISMEALSGSVVDRGAGALAAGCDLVLHCNGALDEMETLADKLPRMTKAATARAGMALAARRAPIDIDISAVEAEFTSLIEGAKNA